MSALSEQITTDTIDFFDDDYEITEGIVVPNVEDIPLGNYGRQMELAMMFVDIRESTKIVDSFRRTTAIKMYKSFLSGISRITRANGGNIRSFNGDGMLVVFSGEFKCTEAGKTALNIHWFISQVLRPKLKKYFDDNEQLQDIEFNFGIGIHVGKVIIVRGGIRGENNNDLVWVGNATNKAVKLSDMSHDDYPIHVSDEVYKKMARSAKYTVVDGVSTLMWYNHGFEEVVDGMVSSSSWWVRP